MENEKLNLIATSAEGRLYNINGFLIVLVSGSDYEMGCQYGELLKDHIKKSWDTLIEPGRKKGSITDEDLKVWFNRGYSYASNRNKNFYQGIAQGSGIPIENICLLDQYMEYGMYESKLHSFSGCSSGLAWGNDSVDGNMYTSRNMDWAESFLPLPITLLVKKPEGGDFKSASVAWPGMIAAWTSINENGVYFDLHDGTSMGGQIIAINRPSTLGVTVDLISESDSLDTLLAKVNGTVASVSHIMTVADEKRAASVERSSLGGNRYRTEVGDSITVVNTFLSPDWGIGVRETLSNSLKRYKNIKYHLDKNKGKINDQVLRNIFDLTLFNQDGTFNENGGPTKPTVQDVDLTNYQVVFDIKKRKIWMKIPVPNYFIDWTAVDIGQLWKAKN